MHVGLDNTVKLCAVIVAYLLYKIELQPNTKLIFTIWQTSASDYSRTLQENGLKHGGECWSRKNSLIYSSQIKW